MATPAPAWAAYAAALLDREFATSRGDSAGPAGGAPDAARRDLAAVAQTAVASADAALDALISGAPESDDGGGDDPASPSPDPLAVTATIAELTPSDVRVLAICAAVELDRDLQRLVAALLADPTATRVEVGLLARLLGPAALPTLGPNGRLARAELLEWEPGAAFAAATIAVPRAVLWALLGDDAPDPGLPVGAEVIPADMPTLGGPDLLLVTGIDRVRRVQAAIAGLGGLGFLLSPLPGDDAEWRAVIRQASVSGLGIILECPGPLDARARHWVERADHLRFALTTREPMPLEAVPHRQFLEIAAAAADVTPEEWAAIFPADPPPSRLPTAQQLQWAAHARRPGQHASEVIHRVTSGSLLRHALRIVPSVTWDDLVLPADQLTLLRGLADRYRHRAVVHDAWGLPLYPSPGVVAMFAGPSGTGKSTAAEVIAGSLGLDMFRVDLSALVSKYIGETEKNLEEIFAAATAGDYVLLFDEADALFGARSKVTDARDRYANMEVSYLLQRLESYDGFVILTSNFQGNIDPAFLRRIHVAVPFAVPDAADRAAIWRRSLAGAPQHDLDIDSVAQRFDLTGGSIRMAALSAAHLAAARGSAIGMGELLSGVNAEMTKLRRRTTTASAS